MLNKSASRGYRRRCAILTNKEKAKEIIDKLPEEKVAYIIPLLLEVGTDKEIEDDLYCERLYRQYVATRGRDKEEFISLEDAAKELGVEL